MRYITTIHNHLDILAGGVHLDDTLMMGKIQPEFAGIGCNALAAIDQLVTFFARTFETAFHINASLIAKSPFFAFVSICVNQCRIERRNQLKFVILITYQNTSGYLS